MNVPLPAGVNVPLPGRCESYQYLGCGGNGNTFSSAADCQALCLPRDGRRRPGLPLGRSGISLQTPEPPVRTGGALTGRAAAEGVWRQGQALSARWEVRPSLPRLKSDDSLTQVYSDHQSGHEQGDYLSSGSHSLGEATGPSADLGHAHEREDYLTSYSHSPGEATGLPADLGHSGSPRDMYSYSEHHSRDTSDVFSGQPHPSERPAVDANASFPWTGDKAHMEVRDEKLVTDPSIEEMSVAGGGRLAEVNDPAPEQAPPGLYCEVTDVDRQGLLRSRCLVLESLPAR